MKNNQFEVGDIFVWTIDSENPFLFIVVGVSPHPVAEDAFSIDGYLGDTSHGFVWYARDKIILYHYDDIRIL